VAVLAVPTAGGLGTLLPLAERVLERLAIHPGVVEELMTLGAEAALEVLRAYLEAPVGHRIGLRARIHAPGRTEGLAFPHVAPSTDQALRAKLHVEIGIGSERGIEGLLLSERRVTALAIPLLERVREAALDQLSREARRVGSRV
jgi:hypothetical protein